ncbi:MAG: hypothetical protein V2J02_21095, partial [Pseudomonadales bacterium]|nr:hypothetical protein [Pseudomonadales bacterium]
MSDVTSHQNSARVSAYPRETTMAPDWDGPIALRPGPDGVRPERPVGRVRVRMLDQEGRPVGGAQARVALIKDGAPRIERIVTAGPTGYVATDFAERAGEATRIEITPMVGGKLREEATRRIDPGQGAGTVLRLPDGVQELVGSSHADLAGFLTPPDLGDAEFAPELFHPSVIERDGTCALDFNASVELREFHFRQLIREDTPSLDGYARDAVDEPIPFDWSPDEEGELRQPQEPVFGRLCLYRQSWSRVGHGLGQLLHSLALAPCEETRIAMIEWSRDESGVRAASARTRENLTHVQFRDRVIDEIVSGAVDESQSGSSSSAQAGAGITGSAGSSGFSLGGSAATAQSASTGHRDLTGRTIQTLSDAVKQQSTAVRSARSTVVTQSDQGERDNIRTRIVRNHNRNHATTVEYFQVVEHYSVQTELLRQEPVVMLPYAVPELLWNRFPAFETVSPMGEIADLKRGLLDVASRAAADLGF